MLNHIYIVLCEVYRTTGRWKLARDAQHTRSRQRGGYSLASTYKAWRQDLFAPRTGLYDVDAHSRTDHVKVGRRHKSYNRQFQHSVRYRLLQAHRKTSSGRQPPNRII